MPLPSLDHIIILVPYKFLANSPDWLPNHFTISPGGRHADGKTENKLVLFSDGSYLELIAFVDDDPKNREGHWWGEKSYGTIDFALTTSDGAQFNYTSMTQRFGDLDQSDPSIGYNPPRAGGRKRDDGVDVKWEITFPTNCPRGEMPFFCHDVTARDLRIPLSDRATTHRGQAEGTYGVESLVVTVPSDRFQSVTQAYEAALGVRSSSDEPDVAVFTVGRVNEIAGAPKPVIRIQRQGSGDRAPANLLSDLTMGRKGDSPAGGRVQIDSGSDSLGGIFIRTTNQ
ncbi:hypothetical protein P152DRAFT_20334 [Eremomyces bilateralis CBS 781.70]|uniref:Glyoxalase-like domain-containing protein n=1 Tax=Eremomyces bilateralis CBS 781.70 TaxID=1392243 RepID=A0A6G1GHP7_9PEZI|nr:uncharacterized protein P152DRAFT_20334 [Eremomyces bilateralis CBS 781.70]KAF1817476.1 hypothetical protein P152DRAFT_20334 [Eremomyces bilateralis CBS 781.70]